MSLINNMLKDLENRENTSRYRPTIVVTSAARKFPSIPLGNKPFWISAGVSLVFAAGLMFLTTTSKPEITPIDQHINRIASSAPDTLNNDMLWLTKANISGVTLQEKDNITEISFLLDHPVLYRLVSNDASNQLSVIIDNAQFQAEVPQLQSMRTALRSVRAQNYQGSVIFNLILSPDSFIKYVNLSTDKKNPELVIAIQHNNHYAGTATVTASSNDMIKMPAMQSLYLEQYQSALKSAERGEFQTAMDQLARLLEAQPAYQDARVTFAALLIDQGNPQLAAKVIDAGLRLSPDFIPLIELKARQLTTQGQIKKALTLLQSESPPISSNPEYHAFMAALYQKNDNNLLAVQLYKRLLSINPQNGNWWFGLGLSLEKLGENSLAYDAYRKAITNGNVNQESMAYLQQHMQSLQENVNAES